MLILRSPPPPAPPRRRRPRPLPPRRPRLPAFGTLNFGTPWSISTFGTPSLASAFGTTTLRSLFGFQQQATPSPSPSGLLGGGGAQITTQMAPVALLPLSQSDYDIQAVVDAYKEDPSNPRYAFRIMWAEATGNLTFSCVALSPSAIAELHEGFADFIPDSPSATSRNSPRGFRVPLPCPVPLLLLPPRHQ